MILDTLFTNGQIYTMKAPGDVVQALGVKDGKIVFTGTNAEAGSWESQQFINLEGRAMIPGMADAHMHMYAHCQNQTFVNLDDVKDMDEMVARLKAKADITPAGNWIKGVNFDQNKFKENRFPTRADLDRVSAEHPVVIKRCCLHAVVANSKALALAGVVKGYDGGTGGIVEVDEDGVPNGILREQSTKVFDEIMPDPLRDPAVKKRIMGEVFADMAKKGVTCIHTYAAQIWRYDEDLETYQELAREGNLPVRVTVCFDELFDPEVLTQEQKEDPYRMVQAGAYKLFSDGSLGSRSAALFEPYDDEPDNKGFVICTQEELTEKVLTGYERGLQPAIHAIGDRALDMTLTAIEETLRITRNKGMSQAEQDQRLPFRIIHVQMINDQLLARMKKLPLILDIQPVFLLTDYQWIEERIGAERAKGSYAWKTLQDAGLIQTGGTDCPVESYDPVKGIFGAVARCDLDGNPTGGYHPAEKLSVYEAIALFTKNVHYATGQQDYLGTLEPGKFADLVVLAQDPFQISELELKDLQVVATYTAGRQVFMVE